MLAFSIVRGIKDNPNKTKAYDPAKVFKPNWVLFIGSICFALFSIILPFKVEKINAGHVGIQTSLVGWDRGVKEYEIRTGWVLYNSWASQLNEFPTFQQHVEYDTQTVITRGGFSADIRPSFNYSLIQGSIGDMYLNLRVPLEQIEQGWLRNAIVSSVNDVANRWAVDSVFNHREQFEQAIIDETNKRVNKWFQISQLRTNITPPPSLQKSIEAKTRATQEAEAAIAQTIVARAEADRMIAVARGDSASKVIAAKAEAVAINLKQQEVTENYIRYIQAVKWDGKLPTTSLGSNTPIMISK
jgi:regulator of protease activity HflC (stomatin/prohibitin superfamily)